MSKKEKSPDILDKLPRVLHSATGDPLAKGKQRGPYNKKLKNENYYLVFRVYTTLAVSSLLPIYGP